jgi:hypothetical protein
MTETNCSDNCIKTQLKQMRLLIQEEIEYAFAEREGRPFAFETREANDKLWELFAESWIAKKEHKHI